MKSDNLTLDNIRSYAGHAARGDYLYGAEDQLLRGLVKSGMNVLDIGCGTGRVTRALARLGASVDACDLDEAALRDARESTAGMDIEFHLADARYLPFEDARFDLVLFSFNGLDFLHPLEERLKVLIEMERLTKPGGNVVISSHNSVGTILSPRGIGRPAGWKARILVLSSLLSGDSYAPDMAGLMLYHSIPSQVVSEVESSTSLRLVGIRSRDGRFHHQALLTLFSAWPYYHFRKPQ